jgi:hypothetical protein
MVSQKGALYDDDSRNRGDESFSDKYQGSKTTNASSLATAVSDSANGDGIELVAGHLHGFPYMQAYRAQGQEREESHGETRLLCCCVQKGG